MKIFLLVALAALFLFGCSKRQRIGELLDALPSKPKRPASDNFISYTIREGEHYCDQNFPKWIRGTEMAFAVRFNTSAVYTLPPGEQDDINKLWGFSEGSSNHYNSARFGWRWKDGQLQLLPYIYIAGELWRPAEWELPVLATAPFGENVLCSIRVAYDKYIFTVNGQSWSFPRGLRTSGYAGYQQYPYFGGDYPAPHLVTILIK
jgi:hypothetical protein